MSNSKFNIDSGFISKLLQTRDMSAVEDNRIRVDYLAGEARAAFKFIQESVSSTGEVPTIRVFERKFPHFALESVEDNRGVERVGTEEGMKFWCDELRHRKKHNTLADSIEEVSGLMKNLDTDEAYKLLKSAIVYVETEVEETSDVDITKDVDKRIQAYLDRKKNKGMRGLATGFPLLDYILKGLEKKTLTTLIANTGVGKALTLNTLILTRRGFVPMGVIEMGDEVCARDGKFYPVTGVYPQGDKDVYRVHFEDGSHVDCCSEHLWVYKTTDDVQRGKQWRVATLREILRNHRMRSGGGYNLRIPVQKPVQFEGNPLPVPPYVVGALLGDGGFTTDRVSFTCEDYRLVAKLNRLLADWGEFTSTTNNNLQYNFLGKDVRENKLRRAFDALGLVGTNSSTKFIPKEYLYASYEDRLELVRGLVDTDGHVNAKGAVCFDTVSPALCEGFMHLIRSLGFRCTRSIYDREGRKIEYRVRVWAKSDLLFSSPARNKQFDSAVLTKRHNYYDHLKITRVENLHKQEPMQCISVDSPDHTFLCGDFIVTHNTWFEVLLGAYCQLQNCRVLQFVTEMSEEVMRDRYEAVLFSKCYKGGFNYNAFKSGTLDLKTEKKFFQFLHDDLPDLEPLFICTATGVMSVAASIDKYKPDLVMIDGAYLMEDDQGAKDDWLRVAHITRDLKRLAKSMKVPILINTQADKNTSKKTGPELGSIMYTQAVGQDSDNVIALFRDEVMMQDKEMGIKVLKQREGTLGKVFTSWDFDTMNFECIYTEGSSNEDEENAEVEEDEDDS